MAQPYDHQTIEQRWLKAWNEHQLFQQTERGANGHPDNVQHQGQSYHGDREYILFAFAYPSGAGLHVGHAESKTALDITARYYRMQGKQVFFPVGWDAFGLPAENYAIKTGVPPAKTTKQAIDTFRRQIKRIGISYDWANEIATCHPEYYRWTQWLFLQLYEAGLAYQKEAPVNWCPSCQTVLANEQVVNGLCERCDTPVTQKEMKQWLFKITEYQDELIEGLDQVDWPEPTKQQQLNWIGRKEGAEVTFTVTQTNQPIKCFTTRVDTVFGVTYLVVSPEKFVEMGLLDQVAAEDRPAVEKYVETAAHKTEEERQIAEKDKSGIDTGLTAINPVNQEEVPVFVADYVLGSYGTGAVMGVPAHDERDEAFARKHNLEIRPVIDVSGDDPTAYGQLINSGDYTGLTSAEALKKIPRELDTIEPTTTYRLRDWLISRQRYWGAPIPIVYDPDGKPHPVKEEHLPWELPTDVDFKPEGESPLASSQELIKRTEELYGEGWRPEFDTMDTFVDSSWYFMRYTDARNTQEFAANEQLADWLPVDFYMIGPEHIVLHLLYSRFFTKFLRDQGYVEVDEPFIKMRHQGMIMGPDGKKMSKSKGNVINPDDVIDKFGADTLRVYEMFMGPIEADKPWDTSAVNGVYRFLSRVHGVVSQQQTDHIESSHEALERQLHQLMAKVTADIPHLKFNTAVAAMMEFLNAWEAVVRQDANQGLSADDTVRFIQILAPFAPFLAEELYHQVSGQGDDTPISVHLTAWPEFDPELAAEDEVTIAVQVNGKVRAELTIAADQVDDQATVLDQARQLDKVQSWLEGTTVAREIYVPGKIINFVVAE